MKMQRFFLPFTFILLIMISVIISNEAVWAASAKQCISTLKYDQTTVTQRVNKPYTPEMAIQWRVSMGDIDKSLAKRALAAIKSRASILGSNMFGPGFNTCYRTFGSRAVDTLHQLIASVNNAGSIQEAKRFLVLKYQKVFHTDAKESERRLCVLAGAGGIGTPNCRIFGESIAKTCRR